LTPEASAQQRFGADLRTWRSTRALSQDALGRLIHASGDLIAKIEKAQRWPSLDIAQRCDAALDTGGALVRLVPLVEVERRRCRAGTQQLAASSPDGGLSRLFASALPPADSYRDPDPPGRQTVRLPAGRMFAPASIKTWSASRSSGGRSHVTVACPPRHDMRPGDLLIASAEDPSGDRPPLYAAAARRSGAQSEEIAIPYAYLLDDFTMGILWAARALDDALLDDDRALAQALERSSPTDVLRDPGTTAPHDLTAVSQGWLGSYACARFISTHVRASSGPPLFWTREQHGEEAAMWLLFDHKVDYLRTLERRFTSRQQPMGRVFCLPESTALADPPAERILLLLAAALMEATGVPVHVCADPDYAAVEGFVLTPDNTVLVANWLRTDRAWHADVIDRRPAVGSYRDALGFGRAYSVIAADTPHDRLRRLADYLHLDWAWLTTRAAQLSAVGVGGLVRPRSRLLSVTGIDAACRFLATQTGSGADLAVPPA
jgi:transcriptional regulator with XRE-family HTH domain